MSPPLHPRWGRPIQLYSGTSHANQCTLSVDHELAGLQALQKVSQFATEGYMSTAENSEHNIDLSTLQSALLLTSDSATFRHLANPPVVSGCIQLMKTVNCQSLGVASPLSYEYGYICFKLLVAALNSCLLRSWDMLDELLATRENLPKHNVDIMILAKLCEGVVRQIFLGENGGSDGWPLGWSESVSHRPRKPLLPKSDISTLLDLVWHDRNLFLPVLLRGDSTEWGLTGLFLFFLRYIARERNERNRAWKDINTRVYELALRYLLVAHGSQREPVLYIIDSTICSNRWPNTPKHIDEADSRMIATAFIDLMSKPDSSGFLHSRGPGVLLCLVPHCIDQRALDVLPVVLRSTIKYGWLRIINLRNAEELKSFVSSFFGPLHILLCPPHDGPPRKLPAATIRTQIIDIFYDNDLLDLTARAIIQLDPKLTQIEEVLRIITSFYENLAQFGATSDLESHFKDYVPMWHRFNNHLHQVLTTCCTGTSTPAKSENQGHYYLCMRTWLEIAQYLGLKNIIFANDKINCFSGRCPAYGIGSVRFGCAHCGNARYCDERCQAV
ncbi:unnamed protein product [Rhizoctonia solani]|uniref:MYND-type domain-containing protein n=1 Tax=Rhizoctonia solani TaxID=456999 RepID=A0A8H3C5U6_9AGAM|nr:unnamed protein product [Rhizoctonia solani]